MYQLGSRILKSYCRYSYSLPVTNPAVFPLPVLTLIYCHNFPSLFQSHLLLSDFSTVCVPIGSDTEHIFLIFCFIGFCDLHQMCNFGMTEYLKASVHFFNGQLIGINKHL